MSAPSARNRRRRSFHLPSALLMAAGFLIAGAGLGRLLFPAPPPEVADAPVAPQPLVEQGPGPSQVEAGVPVGYARTEAGAVAAASQFTAALGSELLLDPDRRAAAFDLIALPEGRAGLERLADTADLFANRLNLTPDLLDAPGLVYETYPVGWQVNSYSDEEAVVQVWNTGLFIAPGREAFTSPWNTATYTLRWEDGDWRVAGLRTEDGPTPPVGEAPQTGVLGEEINEFRGYLYVPAD